MLSLKQCHNMFDVYMESFEGFKDKYYFVAYKSLYIIPMGSFDHEGRACSMERRVGSSEATISNKLSLEKEVNYPQGYSHSPLEVSLLIHHV